MAIQAVDIIIQTALQAGFADLKAHPYLLYDVFNGLSGDKLSQRDYGDKEIKRAADWFMANDTPVYLQYREDNPVFPSVTIVDMGSGEMQERASLGDDGLMETFDPKLNEITPQYVYYPFTPQVYDPTTGYVTFPANIQTTLIVPGQFLVSQRSGKAYQILSVVDGQTFAIKAGVADDFTQGYVTPPTALWNLQRELTYNRHVFAVMCVSNSDPIYAIWLHQATLYALFRYKEAYIEARNVALSTYSSGPLTKDPRFDPEKVFYKQISFVGQVQADWIKYVAPPFQSVTGRITIADGPATPPNYLSEVQGQGWGMASDPIPSTEGFTVTFDGPIDGDPTDEFPGGPQPGLQDDDETEDDTDND